MRAYVAIATDDSESIEGLVRSDFVERKLAFDQSLGDRGHIPYAVVDPDYPRNVLTVRDAPAGERTVIPRDGWQIGRLEDGRMVADPIRVYLSSGLEPGRIYEAVFVSKDPPIAGLELAAMRDAVSQVKYSDVGALDVPAGGIERAITFGDSHAGRYLRH